MTAECILEILTLAGLSGHSVHSSYTTCGLTGTLLGLTGLTGTLRVLGFSIFSLGYALALRCVRIVQRNKHEETSVWLSEVAREG